MQESEKGETSWKIGTLKEAVDAELGALPSEMRARYVRICELIEEFGPMQVGATKHVKHLDGPLWEMRMRGQDGIARAIFIVSKGRRVIVLRAFIKKTRKTPRREIRLAQSRAREFNESK